MTGDAIFGIWEIMKSSVVVRNAELPVRWLVSRSSVLGLWHGGESDTDLAFQMLLF